mmetsp:Transcript_29414/g.68496  ORF Transcript_29414/g.68496 Transcript_29414/m.68496 type:complete len:443 (+) Transcript_29414:540-1868(+)
MPRAVLRAQLPLPEPLREPPLGESQPRQRLQPQGGPQLPRVARRRLRLPVLLTRLVQSRPRTRLAQELLAPLLQLAAEPLEPPPLAAAPPGPGLLLLPLPLLLLKPPAELQLECRLDQGVAHLESNRMEVLQLREYQLAGELLLARQQRSQGFGLLSAERRPEIPLPRRQLPRWSALVRPPLGPLRLCPPLTRRSLRPLPQAVRLFWLPHHLQDHCLVSRLPSGTLPWDRREPPQEVPVTKQLWQCLPWKQLLEIGLAPLQWKDNARHRSPWQEAAKVDQTLAETAGALALGYAPSVPSSPTTTGEGFDWTKPAVPPSHKSQEEGSRLTRPLLDLALATRRLQASSWPPYWLLQVRQRPQETAGVPLRAARYRALLGGSHRRRLCLVLSLWWQDLQQRPHLHAAQSCGPSSCAPSMGLQELVRRVRAPLPPAERPWMAAWMD